MYYTINIPMGKGNKITVNFNENNVRVIDSYKIKKSEDMRYILRLVRYAAENRDLFYKRTLRSWMREWKAHNILYAFNIKRSSTQNTDLYEQEKGKRRFAYFILSLFYWK